MSEPREIIIKKWGCAFKCGRTFKTKKDCIKHQELCWWEPKKKSCVTCIYQKNTNHKGSGDFFNYEPSYWERECIHPAPEARKFFNDELDSLITKSGCKPATNCPHWIPERKKKIKNLLKDDQNISKL